MRLASAMINSVARNAVVAAVLGILFTFGIALGHQDDADHAAGRPHAIPSGPAASRPLDDQWSAVLSQRVDDQWSAGDDQTDSDDQWV